MCELADRSRAVAGDCTKSTTPLHAGSGADSNGAHSVSDGDRHSVAGRYPRHRGLGGTTAIDKMSLRTTLALLIIAVGLGLFIWILDRRSPSTRESRSGYVVDLDRNDVTRVEITNESDNTVLNKTAAGWQIIAPVNDRADAQVVDSLLDNIQFLRRDDIISNLGKGEKKQKRLKDFGLQKPHLKVAWQTKNRHSAIEFGADTAVEGTCYVRTEGSDVVFVTGNELKNLISKRSNAFRDHQITPFLTTQIDRVIVHQTVGDIELVRQQNG